MRCPREGLPGLQPRSPERLTRGKHQSQAGRIRSAGQTQPDKHLSSKNLLRPSLEYLVFATHTACIVVGMGYMSRTQLNRGNLRGPLSFRCYCCSRVSLATAEYLTIAAGSVLRGLTVYSVNLGSHCFGVLGRLSEVRFVSLVVIRPFHMRLFPCLTFQLISLCSYHCRSLCDGSLFRGEPCRSLATFQQRSPTRYSLLCSNRMIGVSSGSGPAFSPVLITFFLFHAQIACFTLSPMSLPRASPQLAEPLTLERSLSRDRQSSA